MEDREREFLLKEFDQAWSMILAIDERRFKFIEYYSAIFAGVVAVAASFVANSEKVSAVSAAVVTILFAMVVIIGFSFLHMLSAERRANIRYRKKVNLIRGLMLGEAVDPKIREYLSHKELGIKTLEDGQPVGIGSTLRGVLGFLYLEIAVLVVGIAAVWTAVALGR